MDFRAGKGSTRASSLHDDDATVGTLQTTDHLDFTDFTICPYLQVSHITHWRSVLKKPSLSLISVSGDVIYPNENPYRSVMQILQTRFPS